MRYLMGDMPVEFFETCFILDRRLYGYVKGNLVASSDFDNREYNKIVNTWLKHKGQMGGYMADEYIEELKEQMECA